MGAVELTVGDLDQGDAGVGIARLTTDACRALGVLSGETVLLEGSKPTAAKVRTRGKSGVIQLDSATRKRAGLAIGETVGVHPVDVQTARQIVVGISDGADEEAPGHSVRESLVGRLVERDTWATAGHYGRVFIRETEPDGTVRVADTTSVNCVSLEFEAAEQEATGAGSQDVKTDDDRLPTSSENTTDAAPTGGVAPEDTESETNPDRTPESSATPNSASEAHSDTGPEDRHTSDTDSGGAAADAAGTDDDTNPAADSTPPIRLPELTKFQRDLLYVIAGLDVASGMDIKSELETYADEKIHHGRLYPNLDTLAEEGVIEKQAVDNRTNGYSITAAGRVVLRARRQWEDRHLATDGTEHPIAADESAQSSSVASDNARPADDGTSTDKSTTDVEDAESLKTSVKQPAQTESDSETDGDRHSASVDDALDDLLSFDRTGDEQTDDE